MPVKRKRSAPIHPRTFSVFGVNINVNTIATTVAGGVTLSFVSWGIHAAKSNYDAIQQVIQDVQQMKMDQDKVHRAYFPLATPTPTAAP